MNWLSAHRGIVGKGEVFTGIYLSLARMLLLDKSVAVLVQGSSHERCIALHCSYWAGSSHGDLRIWNPKVTSWEMPSPLA